MKRQNLIIIIGLIIFGIWYFSQGSKVVLTSDENSGIGDNSMIVTETNFMKVEMYDLQGNPIKINPSSQSIVSVQGGPQNIGGVGFIRITPTVTNTGTAVLSCTVSGTNNFNNTLSALSKLVTGGNSISWTSELINMTQYENTQQAFIVTANCNYYVGTEQKFISKIGNVTISIYPDAVGGMQLDVVSGGISTESYEYNYTNKNINFRTSDTGYVALTGAGIGYNTTCGSKLLLYGYSTSSLVRKGTCNAANVIATGLCGTSPTANITLPGGWLIGGPNPTLYRPTTTGLLCICDADGTTTTSNYQVRVYSTSVATNVSNLGISTQNTATEVTCN